MKHLLAPLPRAAVTLLAAVGIAGCGGGGGSADADAGAGSMATAAAVGSAAGNGESITAITTATASGDATTATALGPNELAVLIAAGDATSEAIGLAYQQARGIPEANMVRVPVPATGSVISAADFATLKAAIDARLPSGVQASLVTWSQPSEVLGSCKMGLTSALALGYSTAYCGGCVRTLASGYYNSASHRPWTDLRVRPSMMLGASTLAEAQALIARGVAADGRASIARTLGSAWLMRTSDAGRSVRWEDFVALAATSVRGITMNYVDNSTGQGSDSISGQKNVMFHFTGLSSVPGIASNTYAPGAVADHLTSAGGSLPDGGGAQMPITDWLRAGVTASYGTVEEPCNYQTKFPRASVLVNRYQQGDTLIEAYWKSVQWPGQGLFVGEPLARPWAR